jgi:Arc/MetJ family transcription regulator
MEELMRTLIDIQDDLMEELLKEANTGVKKEAIILAIKTFLDVRRREKLASLIGNYEFGYSLEELEEMRKDG